jgi:hypothetical protein
VGPSSFLLGAAASAMAGIHRDAPETDAAAGLSREIPAVVHAGCHIGVAAGSRE